MPKRLQAGNSTQEGLLILAVLIVIIIITLRPGANRGQISSPTLVGNNSSESGIFGGSSNSSGTYTSESTSGYVTSGTVNESKFAKNIYIGSGNAPYTYQPYEEYITIENWNDEPVNITGWQLKNGKSERPYDIGGALQYFSSDIALVPQGTLFISPLGNNLMQNISLGYGETAIVTTGSVGSALPYRIVSFKENICSGYLGNMDEYSFNPPLSQNCPYPRSEPGLTGLSSECRQFVERLSSCHKPEFNTRDEEGKICTNCVNGTPLPGSCVAFIKAHFSYQGCIAYHAADPDFSTHTWRVFLGRGWEMWARDYETISLFDNYGRLIKQKSY